MLHFSIKINKICLYVGFKIISFTFELALSFYHFSCWIPANFLFGFNWLMIQKKINQLLLSKKKRIIIEIFRFQNDFRKIGEKVKIKKKILKIFPKNSFSFFLLLRIYQINGYFSESGYSYWWELILMFVFSMKRVKSNYFYILKI